MKTKLICTLYRLMAFLADKTKGFLPFVKWKLALGSLLLSITVASCASKRNADTVDEPKPDEIGEPTCYEPAVPVAPADTTANINIGK